MVHFPPGITIDDGQGGTSCQDFCAYHGSYTHGGKSVYYGVIPDQGGPCATGCAGDPDLFKDTCAVASHEMVEATTDPDVNATAWIDATQGEIGDICVGQLGSAAGYTVQLEWSNKLGACVDHGPAVAPMFSLGVTPAAQTVVAGGAATFTVSTTGTAGIAETIAFSVSGLPAGASAAFDRPSAMTGTPVTLTVTTTASATGGATMFSITAAGASSQMASATLTITPAPAMAGGGGDTGGGGGGGGGGGVGGGGASGATGGDGTPAMSTSTGGCELAGSGAADVGFAVLLLAVLLGCTRWRRRAP